MDQQAVPRSRVHQSALRFGLPLIVGIAGYAAGATLGSRSTNGTVLRLTNEDYGRAEKLLSWNAAKLVTNADTVAAEVEAAVIRHRTKSASATKDKLKERARYKAEAKRRKAK